MDDEKWEKKNMRERERERLQCFSQPASLITYRRRQRSNVENMREREREITML